MTHLRTIMLEELQRRHYSEATIQHYIRFPTCFGTALPRTCWKPAPTCRFHRTNSAVEAG